MKVQFLPYNQEDIGYIDIEEINKSRNIMISQNNLVYNRIPHPIFAVWQSSKRLIPIYHRIISNIESILIVPCVLGVISLSDETRRIGFEEVVNLGEQKAALRALLGGRLEVTRQSQQLDRPHGLYLFGLEPGVEFSVWNNELVATRVHEYTHISSHR